MSGQEEQGGSLFRALGVRTAREGDQVTTLELFFDLVFVFAFTQVTYVMSHGEPPLSVLQGLIVLALLWWSWSSFAWLGNQAHANEGLVRVSLIIAMGAVFVLSLTIPEAYHDLEGGLYAPLVFAICYAVIRLVHLTTYLIAAGPDAALRRQVLMSLLASALPSIVLLVIGAFVDEQWRVVVWAGAIIVDLLAIYVTSNVGGGWRVQSVAHFTERHRLVVILALGESIVAIGVGVSLSRSRSRSSSDRCLPWVSQSSCGGPISGGSPKMRRPCSRAPKGCPGRSLRPTAIPTSICRSWSASSSRRSGSKRSWVIWTKIIWVGSGDPRSAPERPSISRPHRHSGFEWHTECWFRG